MNEEAIKHAFDLFVRDGYGGDINKFQKLLATNPRALEHSFKLFEKDGYKEGAEKYNLLMGLNQVPYAPQDNPIQIESAPAVEPITTAATTTPEPVKTEPAKELSNKQSETIKVRSIHQGESEMPVADGAKMPPMVVRKIETIAEEEPANKLPVSTGLTPITDKTEVKAIQTPSDKMVIKSDKKVEEPVKAEEPKGIPSYKGIDKNTDIGGGVFTDKTKISSNLDAKELSPKEILDGELLTKGWYNIELNRNVSSRYPDPPNVDVKKTIKSENVGVFKPIKIGEENYYTNYDKDSKKWHLYKEGSNDNEWKELKNGAIKSMLNSKLLNNNGEPIKEQIDYTEKDANEINLAKKKLAYSKYLQYLVNNFDDLTEKEQQQVKDVMQQDQYDKYYRWISQNVDDPKVIDFWIKALEKTNTDSYYLEEIKKKKAH